MRAFGKEPYCLVLGGGGAKGVYHAGVWKALRELDVQVNAFIGNSVGALIAAILVQGDDQALEEFADTIDLGAVLDVPDELVENGRLTLRRGKLPLLGLFTRDILKHRGIDTSPLRHLLESHVDEERIRRSKADFGLQTFNLSDMKPEGKFIEEIADGTLVEYVLASSALPGFVAPIIQGKKYVDGGVYDNVPYRMARRRGYRRIIAVDLSGPGVTRRPDIRGTETVYIRNSIHLGGALDFNRDTLNELRRLGYLDTLRAFGRLTGYRYFVEGNQRLEQKFLTILSGADGRPLIRDFLTSHNHEVDQVSPYDIRRVFPREMGSEKLLLLALLDCTAHFMDVPRIQAYSYGDLIEAIQVKKAQVEQTIERDMETNSHRAATRISKGIESMVKGALKREDLDRSPYYYFKLLDYLLKEKTKRLLKARLSGFFPTAQPSEFLLSVIDRL
jgi:NTE family protein